MGIWDEKSIVSSADLIVHRIRLFSDQCGRILKLVLAWRIAMFTSQEALSVVNEAYSLV